jgi:hypothetical protein
VYGRAVIRVGIILVLGVLSTRLPSSYLDRWLWLGVRDLRIARLQYLPLAVAIVMVLADCLGAWSPPWMIAVRRPRWWAVGVAIVAALVLWTLRVPQWLGDYAGFDRGAPAPWFTVEPAEPLGAYTSYYTLHWGQALGWKNSTAVGLVVTAFGASAVAALFLWTRLITAEWPLSFTMLVTSGFMVLFCGYPEKGTPKAVALVCWYVYVTARALREQRAWQFASSGTLLALGGLMHGSALCWLPAHVWYVWRPLSWRRTAVGVLAFLAPVALMAWYVVSGKAVVFEAPWGNVAAPWQWIKAYCVTNCGYDFWSSGHFVDVLNCLLALSPVAFLCLPEALLRARTTSERWLALGSLGWLFLSATWFPVFGYLSDWDIFAGTPLVISCCTILVGTRVMPATGFRRLAFAWIAGTVLHAASFWWLFHTPLG